MKQNANSNTALFLMELIVVIGFFSLVAVICVRLFVAASVSSGDSVDVNQAVRAEESLAEAWIACDGDLLETAGFFPSAALTETGSPLDGSLSLYFDADWQRIGSPEDAAYQATLAGRATDAAAIYGNGASGRAAAATITVTALTDDTVICTLDVDHYLGGAQ